jgi:nucleoside-diphosphate-sugar epimerase
MVDDLIEVLNFLCKSNWVGKEIYNIGYKTPYSLDEIIETLASLGMGVELNIEKSKMLDFDRRSMKQSDIPGYSYKLDMPEALKLYYKQINKSE